MHNIDWRWYRFSEFSNLELYELLRLRQQVFVVEQQCIFNDADGLDRYSRHLVGWQTGTQEAVASLRIVPALVKYPEVSIGRVVNSAAVRGIGVGRELIGRALAYLDSTELPVNRIGAQHHLQSFYASFGYEPDGEPYDEDGILHIEMIRRLPNLAQGHSKTDISARLTYEPLVANHASELFSALSDTAIYQYMDEERYSSEAGLRDRYSRLERGAPLGSGQVWLNWAVKNNGQAIGTVQATLFANAQADIGYALSPTVWGQGFGTEAVKWLCKVLTQRYGTQRIRAQVDSRNLASWKALESAGFERQVSISSELKRLPSVDFVYGFGVN
jgi:ElaA protein